MDPVNRPVCYMDISIAGKYAGRVTYQLFSDIVPRTAENFRALCTGERGFGYRGCHFHRIVPGLLCQTGDITNNNGLGGRSIYGAKFDDENFAQAHAGPGILSMANAGANTNGSQFFVTLAKQPSTWLDGKHVVFGQVVKGMKVIREIEKWGTVNGKPQKYCVIMDAGELTQ